MSNNRIFKFRCWDTKNKHFINEVPPKEYMLDSDCWDHPNNSDELMMCYPSSPLTFFKDRLIYNQFTGLKDKNGKEIYEGDIVDYFDWCYASRSEKDKNTSDKKIENLFTNAYGDKFNEVYYPLRGIVKWNQEYLTYEPLIFSQDDYNGNCFANVCVKDKSYNSNYPDSYFEIIGNIFENKELIE